MTDLTKFGIFFSELTGEVYLGKQSKIKFGLVLEKRPITETFDMISNARKEYLEKQKINKEVSNG